MLETIEALPQGFDTRIGEDGAVLSGGQRQRVALARAMYGEPRLVVLDEPNASLDEAGERALLNMLLACKARGATVVVITHRTTLMPAADKLLVLPDGQTMMFGPRDDVLAALKKANDEARAKARRRRAARRRGARPCPALRHLEPRHDAPPPCRPGSSPRPRPRGASSSAASWAACCGRFRREFAWVGLFSLVANLLMLTPTLYMLQVFDRVMVSRSELTLLALTLTRVPVPGDGLCRVDALAPAGARRRALRRRH